MNDIDRRNIKRVEKNLDKLMESLGRIGSNITQLIKNDLVDIKEQLTKLRANPQKPKKKKKGK